MIYNESQISQVLNDQLKLLAPKYLSIKIAKVHEKHIPFLVQRFNTSIPALILVKENIIINKVGDFDKIDMKKNSSYKLKQLIIKNGLIEDEELSPDVVRKPAITQVRKNIRGTSDNSDSD